MLEIDGEIFRLKVDDKNKGIHRAYIMVLEIGDRDCKLVYEAVG